jgi:transposase-like protein
MDVGALTASKLSGVNKNTTHRIYGLLRQRVVSLAEAEATPLSGSVEVDESYFGPRRVRGLRGRGAGRKIPVIGLLKRGGKVFCSPVMNCSKAELMGVIRGQVLQNESTIYTDGWRAYDGLVTEGYKHYRIHHHRNEFARGKKHINGIESFWSFAKLRLAKLRGVRWDLFYDHLKETEWRFNHRRDNLTKLLTQHLKAYPLI